MLTILDVSNHWSPTGGGVRRYQLEKCRALAGRPDVRHVLVTPDDRAGRTQIAPGVEREHLRAPLVPGTGGYRYLIDIRALADCFEHHRPDIVVCGSPIVMPDLVTRALARTRVEAQVVGFWHADFPRTYTGRAFAALHPRFEPTGEALGWWWARRTYGRFATTIVASRRVEEKMRAAGIERTFYSPLGVDTERFRPERRDPEKVRSLRGADASRRTIIFPHRFCAEKGIDVMLRVYPQLVARARAAHRPEPGLIFAGTGPRESEVIALCEAYPHARHLGFVGDPAELASWYASADLTVSLSAWETFGLSTAEALASGLPVVASDRGAAPELVEGSGAGRCVDASRPGEVLEALEELLDSEELPALGRRGRAFAEGLTWDATFERELSLYRSLVAEGPSLASSRGEAQAA